VIAASGARPLRPVDPPQELNLLKEYNERLVSKLEEKNSELGEQVAALLQAEQRMKLQATALETAANGILITDREGTILWVNPAFTVLTGYPAEEAIGQNPSILKSGQHDRPFYRQLWGTILKGNTWRGQFANRRKDGTLYYDEH